MNFLKNGSLSIVMFNGHIDKKLFLDKVVDCSDCQLVISSCGDGTLRGPPKLLSIQKFQFGCPYGHLGFLTSATPHQMILEVADALAGATWSRRATLCNRNRV